MGEISTKRQPGKRKVGLAVLGGGKEESPLVEFVSVKSDVSERYNQLPRRDRSRFLAYASVVWGVEETARLTGVQKRMVWKSRKTNRLLTEEMDHVRVHTAAQVCLSKALKIADSINIDKIPDDRKAQSVKALMDACDIAKLQGIRTNGEVETDETVELFYRVKRRLRAASRDESGGADVSDEDGREKTDPPGGDGKVIDITGEIEEVKAQ